MKIAINKCFGGFDLSDKAFERMVELGVPMYDGYAEQKEKHVEGVYVIKTDDSWGKYHSNFRNYENRDNNILIKVVEELQEEASGRLGDIEVVEIPDDIEFEIDDYDGIETVREKHRSW